MCVCVCVDGVEEVGGSEWRRGEDACREDERKADAVEVSTQWKEAAIRGECVGGGRRHAEMAQRGGWRETRWRDAAQRE